LVTCRIRTNRPYELHVRLIHDHHTRLVQRQVAVEATVNKGKLRDPAHWKTVGTTQRTSKEQNPPQLRQRTWQASDNNLDLLKARPTGQPSNEIVSGPNIDMLGPQLGHQRCRYRAFASPW